MSLESELEKIDRILEFLRKLEAIDQPANVRDAVTQGWELEDEILAGVMEGYKEVERKSDSQRVVPVKAVLSIMAQFEEETVRKLVSSPGEILWGMADGVWTACVYIVTHAFDILRAIIDSGDVVELLIQYVDDVVEFIFSYFTEIVTVLVVLEVLKKGAQVRNDFATRMRKRALPQSNGERRWRKKSTRV